MIHGVGCIHRGPGIHVQLEAGLAVPAQDYGAAERSRCVSFGQELEYAVGA